jgi:hypothetical protein
MSGEYLRARSLSKFKTQKIDWLLRPFIPFGFITTVAGDGEVGKSTMLYDLLARVTIGEPMPRFGDQPEHRVRRGSVIVLSKEDDPGLLIKPRLEAAGADTRRVKIIGVPRSRTEDDFEVISRLDDTIGDLENIIGELADVRVIVVDPITDFAGKLDLYREDQVRRLLSPLARLAARHKIAVVNVLHLIKDVKKKPRQRIMGSAGLVNASRSVLIVGRNFQTGRRFLMMEKANLWHERKSVAFNIKNVEGQPQVSWDADWEEISIEEILSGKSVHVTKQQDAGFKLRAWLDDGPILVTALMAKAEAIGIGWNTVKAAKRELGVRSFRRDDAWWWELQEDKGDDRPTRERL